MRSIATPAQQSAVCTHRFAPSRAALKPPSFATCIAARSTSAQRNGRGSLCTVCVGNVSEADWDAEVLQEYGGTLKVVKVEADPNPKLVEQYQVYGLPTLLIVKDGAVLEGSKHEGAIGKDKLFQYLEKHGLVKVNA